MIYFTGWTNTDGRVMSVRTRTFSAPTTIDSVPAARRRARSELAGCGLNIEHPVLGAALVVFSELVTNSVVHAAGHSSHFSVTITVRPGTLVIAVHDRHPHVPGLRPESAGHDDCNGRGLNLVAHLSAEAGGHAETVPDPDGGGKTIRASLPLPAEARSPDGATGL
ncbi:ATP-binding protein [Streptomyces meridianus]|uniref:ATP-binding protein n=1 Tax=Streptomyces meridianus TaxID=2938945 RepID=A0ABT0X3C0_9ACTN|nr:ATP-binding protein [Streptomyces meridianus]MCM2577045.1 ATP-binding protein [Streptomyces meridianus]